MARRLKDWLSTHLDFTDNSEAPLSYHTWAGISCIAAALQRKTFMRWSSGKLYPNNYIIIVGPSGRCRKGDAIMPVRDMIAELNIPTIGEDNSQEAVILDIRHALTNFTDATTGKMRFQCAVSCFLEELAVFTGQQNSTFLAYLTNWYDSRDKWTRRTKHQGTDEIIGMCFNLLAATAPDWLPHILTREATGGGFTSRCIFVVETERRKIIANPNLLIPDKLLRRDLLHDLELIHMLTGEFELDPETQTTYEDWYRDQCERDDSGTSTLPDPLFDGYRGRRPVHLIKTAMCLSASRGDDLTITPYDFNRALTLLTETEERMGDVFAGLGRARYVEETDMLISYIERHRVVKKSQVLQDFYRNLDDASLDAITKVLSGMKVIEVERIPGDILYRFLEQGDPS